MEPRLDLLGSTVTTKFVKYLVSASKVVTDSALPAAAQELVKLRASQINGCAFCTDMHTKDALQAGETQLRLNLVAVWREATVFTEAERAALELAEQGTRIADAATGVTDEASRPVTTSLASGDSLPGRGPGPARKTARQAAGGRDGAAAGYRVGCAGRGRPGATVRARIPSVARSALSGTTGKMAASFQLCSAADQS
jgi:AhpD family alkylhydroperoxidase